ncbi:putative outer membrane starch-binding protein [Mucilaginibacter gracilis]|uniref:Putative outer membrane starch-binding protein n=1 Tax=Mucilaginibacter gracilis TaxID=423350 RepID=A0A495IT30_9SPHI|nr:RagB/SusD family nutrient uptake outer membrane protein [Mucilaginibacter gracilis]RKR79936.1 putative outer membrane starch-binding protein [Mucilaginibacter gracilis]
MKKIIILTIILSSLCSCQKMLDATPTDFLAAETYFTNETQLQSALTAVYDQLQKGGMFGSAFTGATSPDGMSTSLNLSDEMYFASSGTGTRALTYSSSDPLIFAIWSACYVGIQRANIVLANINKPTMDEGHRAIAKGEAMFLRAFFYFILAENFGDVPLRTAPTQSVLDVNIARTPLKQVYEFIISEMTTAEGLVAPATAYAYNERITQSTVRGILARVCLYAAGFPNNDVSKYALAASWAKKVMDSGLHQLNASYSQVFINMVQNLYDTKESLWEIGYYTTGQGDTYTEYAPGLSVFLGVTQTNSAYPLVTGAYRIHQRVYNYYEKDPNLTDPLIPDKSLDLRRDWAIAPFKYTSNNQATGKAYYTAAQIYDRQPNKFDRAYELTGARFQSSTPTNFSMLRYSDVLLMFAEADNEVNGPTTAGVNAVNLVRERGYGKLLNGEGVKQLSIANAGTGYTTAPTITISGGGGSGATATATVSGGKITSVTMTNHGTFYTSTPTVTISGGGGTGGVLTPSLQLLADADLKAPAYADQATFRQTIQDERARELCFEGWRKLDLVRWGIYISTLQSVTAEDNINAPSTYKAFAVLPGNLISPTYLLQPIPANEISLNNLIKQNPGW